MSKKKLLLINPVSSLRKGFTLKIDAMYPPLSLGILAALTPDNWDIEIFDENFDTFNELIEADLVALTSFTSSAYRAYEIAAVYKKANIPVVMGGIHASMVPKEAIQYVDVVGVGEAESYWKNVISDFEKGRLKPFYYGERLPMDKMPFARHDLFHKSYTIDSIQTTRGCPFNCSFCSVTAFNGSSYRMRPVEDVLDEIEMVTTDRIFFIDDNLVGYSKKSKKHVKAILQGMIDRKVNKEWWTQCSLNVADDEEILDLFAKSGCRMIFIGIEAETVEGLRDTNKKLNTRMGFDKYTEAFNKIHKYGMSVLGSFIFGLDSDTVESLHNRKQYIINQPIDSYQTGILTPLPGTKMYREFEEQKRIIKNDYPKDWQYYSIEDVVMKPAQMDADTLKNTMKEVWLELYDKKTVYRKFMQTLNNTKNIKTSSWAITTNLVYRAMVGEVFGFESFSIEDIIGKGFHS
jgi:radical SAM superfamily enzyme YgiQ (UPF0313 family)